MADDNDLSDEELAELLEACEKRTQGKWHVLDCGFDVGKAEKCGVGLNPADIFDRAIFKSDSREQCWHPIRAEDARAIVLAANALPRLLAEIKRRREEADEAYYSSRGMEE